MHPAPILEGNAQSCAYLEVGECPYLLSLMHWSFFTTAAHLSASALQPAISWHEAIPFTQQPSRPQIMAQGHWCCTDCTETVLVSRRLEDVNYMHFWRCCHCGFGENNYPVHDGCYYCDRNSSPFICEDSLVDLALRDMTKILPSFDAGQNGSDVVAQVIRLAEIAPGALPVHKQRQMHLPLPVHEQAQSRFEILLDLDDQSSDLFQGISPGPSDLSTGDEFTDSEWSDDDDDDDDDGTSCATSLLDQTFSKFEEDDTVSHFQRVITKIVTRIHSNIQQQKPRAINKSRYGCAGSDSGYFR